MMNNIILEVKDLKIKFESNNKTSYAVNGLDFCLREGEVLGIVGESGCGKSVTLFSILGLLPGTAKISGDILYKSRNILAIPEKEFEKMRGKEIAMIFQDPMSSLNPVFTIREQLVETIRLHDKSDRRTAYKRAIELLEMVEIPYARERINLYPHQLSGGMRQRVMIAIALSCRPSILLADEPTTALDVTVQMQILKLLRHLSKENHMSVVIVSHDLGVIEEIADRAAVVYGGRILEEAAVDELFDAPKHPYTRGLMSCLPLLEKRQDRLNVIEGMVADITQKPEGCTFSSRCKYGDEECGISCPSMEVVRDGHRVACHHWRSL